ncbi:ras association domain-containing protein 8-like [Erpetoichthys calabaricus]|uniref:ras association domain-containing protein 8-like n=1 Tax=Erpetoichthys calabaricus TaxID=27687 RepID=UPI0022349EB6|nr:ras association domain-containing protein 8-like [Erpetoichthys calabaricus]
MELKVWVDGVQRVICGVSENTSCQEVVIALAQSMGKTGRYILKEKFKEFERSISPEEKLMESLNKYGQQANEVHLILNYNGPSAREKPEAHILRGQSGPDNRLHRQSLPPQARTKIGTDSIKDSKKPKRKSLTFAEEAKEWIESFSKAKFNCVKVKSKEVGKRNSTLVSQLLGEMVHASHQPEDLDLKDVKEEEDPSLSSCSKDVVEELHQLLRCQKAQMEELQTMLAATEEELKVLEEQEELEAEICRLQHLVDNQSPEVEELEYWENELRAEEVHEKDLQQTFLEMKWKVQECKLELEEYRHRIQGLNPRNRSRGDSGDNPQEKMVHPMGKGQDRDSWVSTMDLARVPAQETGKKMQVLETSCGTESLDRPAESPFTKAFRYSDTSFTVGPLKEWEKLWSKATSSLETSHRGSTIV